MTFNAASRLRSLEDRSAALGSRRCELPGMHSVRKSAVLPYASGVGGLSRRLLNTYTDTHVCIHMCVSIYVYTFTCVCMRICLYTYIDCGYICIGIDASMYKMILDTSIEILHMCTCT